MGRKIVRAGEMSEGGGYVREMSYIHDSLYTTHVDLIEFDAPRPLSCGIESVFRV